VRDSVFSSPASKGRDCIYLVLTILEKFHNLIIFGLSWGSVGWVRWSVLTLKNKKLKVQSNIQSSSSNKNNNSYIQTYRNSKFNPTSNMKQSSLSNIKHKVNIN